MSAAILSQLYVQVTARGVAGASAEVKAMGGSMKQAKGILDQMSRASEAQGKLLQQMGSAARMALVPMAALSATLIGLTAAGLAGTVQMHQLQMQFQLLTREIANAMLPIVEALIDGMKMLWRFLQSVGLTGQNTFLILGAGILGVTAGLTAMVTVLGLVAAAMAFVMAMAFPLAAVVMAVSVAIGLLVGGFVAVIALSPNLRAAFMRLFEAAGRLYVAIEPIAAGLMRIGMLVVDVFVVSPLINFLEMLTAIITKLERMVEILRMVSPLIAILYAVGNVPLPGVPNKRRAVSLDQTGSESGEGTFARIQEAILRMSAQEDVPKQQLNELRGIRKGIENIAGGGNRGAPAPGPVNPAPLAAGHNEALGLGTVGAVFGGVAGVIARERL